MRKGYFGCWNPIYGDWRIIETALGQTPLFRKESDTHRCGKRLGRPRIDPTLEKRIQSQLKVGKGVLKVATECGVGSGTVQRIKREMVMGTDYSPALRRERSSDCKYKRSPGFSDRG